MYRVGVAYLNMSKYEKGMLYLFDSMTLSQRQGICDLQILVYIAIGDIYFDIGEYEKSTEYYNYAEKLTKIISKRKNYYNESFEFYAAKIYNRMGEIYRILRCYEYANIYYNLSVNLDNKLNYKATFGVALSNLAYVEFHLGHYDKAMENLNEALIYLNKYDYKSGIVEAYGLFALIHEKKGNYDECEKYFSKAMAVSSEISYVYAEIDLLLDYSNFLENTGKRDVAIGKLDEIYRISIENKMYAKTMEICKRAITLYEKANDVNNANIYYKLYFKYQKELEYLELENRATNLKSKVQLDNLEDENKRILEKSESFRRKTEELTETIKNISIISELGEKITTTLDLNQIYQMIHNTIQSFMKANTFGIGLYNEKKNTIEYQYLIENNVNTKLHEVNYDNPASMAVKCLRENKIITINDMFNEYSNYVDDLNYIIRNKENSELNSAIYCPLTIDNNLIGVITVQAFEKNSFTSLTIEIIKALSSYAAIAINNAIKSKNLLLEVQQRREVELQLKDTNNKLIYLSENDGLTNIPNRRKFDGIITEEWNKAKDRKSHISIIIFDIDCFKQYNDNYGHIEGDNCLIKISKILSQSLVKNYFAARYGGDEFVIVLPDTNLEEAMKYGEDFRLIVERLSLIHKFSTIRDTVTVTLGVSSVLPDNNSEIAQFIKHADEALYKAKNKGRNQIIGCEYENLE
ncbi:diguanylate cyclase [Clostridium bowmanii]|uniref:diguanylate cyclase domain-containing protein n=1 Tax=Clostridium bowmanii TaxID=132925 RepID=UPI001C0D0813|nr:diguanylate cyclase [Clostridium bowmanii]MBU3189611.1 diguanylate cyclase [Clostridium bowmanii]MCA1073545.1 diguanylate cyclase [Clostridium bowmanii]